MSVRTPILVPSGEEMVYISSPYTLGDVAVNVRNSMEAFNKLFENGIHAVCPLLSHFLHMMNPQPYEKWLEYDLHIMKMCNIFLRLPGESKGAEVEKKAWPNELPYYDDIYKLIEDRLLVRKLAEEPPKTFPKVYIPEDGPREGYKHIPGTDFRWRTSKKVTY